MMPCNDVERLNNKTHVGVRPQGSQENSTKHRLSHRSSVAWVSCRKFIPGIHVLWIDQVKEGLEQCRSGEPIRLLI